MERPSHLAILSTQNTHHENFFHCFRQRAIVSLPQSPQSHTAFATTALTFQFSPPKTFIIARELSSGLSSVHLKSPVFYKDGITIQNIEVAI